jgi:hypothetical protein
LCYIAPVSSRRFVALAAALGAAVGLVLTAPLALHIRSRVLEDGTYDAYQFLWNLWWVRESLCRLHTSPFHTRYLFYPEGTGLFFHTLSSSLGVASIPLQAVAGLVAAHNVLVIAAPVLTTLTTALLAREVTGDGWAALAAAPVAATSAIAVWFAPVLYLDCLYLVTGLLWCWWRAQRLRRWRDIVLVLLVLAALVFASPEYALIALALLALDSIARMLGPRAVAPRWGRGMAAFWGIAALGLGTLAVVVLAVPAAPPPPEQLTRASGYAAGLVTPPWLIAPPFAFFTILYLGTVPLALVPAAIWWQPRRAAYWVAATCAAALLAMGPYIRWHHPLAGLEPPFPEIIPPGILPGPYWILLRLVPGVAFFRAPYRWIVGAEVAIAVVAALGIAGLRQWVDGARRPVLTAAALALVLAGAALDVRGLRAPLAGARVPAAYAALRDDPDSAAVLELPAGMAENRFAAFSSLYMYFQTTHRKFLLDGTVARLPLGRRVVIERTPEELLGLPFVKYVVLHRDLLTLAYPSGREQAREIERRLATAGELVARDGAIDVYRLRTFHAAAVQ